MASKKTLTESSLEALGARRLAELLIEISAGNAAAKRLLRLELAAAQSSGEVAREIRKRLAAVARSRSFVDWRGVRPLADDLETQRRTIADRLAPSDPAEGLALMWRFLELAGPVFERCDDGSGRVIGIFRAACSDLGNLAVQAKSDPKVLADRAFEALLGNGYGQFDGLIATLAPALGGEGLGHLEQRMIALSKEPVRRPASEERRVVAWGSSGPLYADELAEQSRVRTVRSSLQDIADARGDVDGFVAQYDARTRKVPRIAVEIARRLLAAGRATEAWQAIEAAEHRERGWPDLEWEDARVDVLEALGRGDEAQAARWSCFERSLSGPHLRAYLSRLADFDDVAAEARALDHAERYESLPQALSFLVSWPEVERAARMVVRRAGELDGDDYEILTPAADALAGKHPLAATLVLRAMIDFSLTRARSSRYGHAARHLMDCAGLASRVQDFGAFEGHDTYVAKLRREHPKKSSFWSLIC